MQLASRGTTEKEITEAIQSAPWQSAEFNRMECRKNYPYNQNWNGKFYGTKQVRPIFVEEKDRVVLITVYVYYF